MPHGGDDIFADPFLDGPPSPKLRLLLLRDNASDVVDATAVALADAVAATARQAGVRVSEHTAEPGHPLERLAGHVALTEACRALEEAQASVELLYARWAELDAKRA